MASYGGSQRPVPAALQKQSRKKLDQIRQAQDKESQEPGSRKGEKTQSPAPQVINIPTPN